MIFVFNFLSLDYRKLFFFDMQELMITSRTVS